MALLYFQLLNSLPICEGAVVRGGGGGHVGGGLPVGGEGGPGAGARVQEAPGVGGCVEAGGRV